MRAVLVITDSGGIQEEAPELGLPVLVMREKTERPEAVKAGVAQIVGTERATIVDAAARLLKDASAYRAMTKPHSLYGDGKAAQRIVAAVLRHRPNLPRGPQLLPEVRKAPIGAEPTPD